MVTPVRPCPHGRPATGATRQFRTHSHPCVAFPRAIPSGGRGPPHMVLRPHLWPWVLGWFKSFGAISWFGGASAEIPHISSAPSVLTPIRFSLSLHAFHNFARSFDSAHGLRISYTYEPIAELDSGHRSARTAALGKSPPRCGHVETRSPIDRRMPAGAYAAT